jgi:hypothetical protein
MQATKEKPLEAMFSVRSVPRLYNDGQLPLQKSLETAVTRVGGWCEMAASLRGREPGCRRTFTGEDTADLDDLVCAVVNCRVREFEMPLQLFVVTFCKCSIKPITNTHCL